MFKSKLQQYFIAGLLVWLPLVITVWVLMWLLGMLDGIFVSILATIEAVVPGLTGMAQAVMKIPGIGVLALGLLILLTGTLAANIVGQWWIRQWDALMARIPVVRSIYSSVKQVSDTLFSGSGKAFSKALLVQYPRHGSWTVAFLTGHPGGEVARHLPGAHVSVYVPTTPNPTSGFFLMMARDDVIELDMTVDEALKYIISMGVVVPPEHVGNLSRKGGVAARPLPQAEQAPAAAPAAPPAHPEKTD
ncbi:DUF502 domain-containing protein [Brachymonas denitrificans]|uniref:DUF502 domain-containing protein n=1 Tax=Brachymonas denitrificans TaxID=28220 RepID=UPI002AFEBBF0|nr:DUF502 domain-containing protein [Brachymonas denitrificans]